MKNLIIALAFGAVSTTAAFAQASFSTVDADGNGAITFTEAVNAGMPWSEDQFKAADGNSDGALDETEFTAALQ